MTMPRALRILIKDRETGWTFTLLLCLVYTAFLIWMQAHHEMWRDEVHAWTLSRLAHGFSELVSGDRSYEGHPPLWFWYLHIWSWFVESAWGIQAATIAAATAAAVLVVRFAPFPRYLKILLLFSYYFGHEYAVMARNYVLGWFLVCLFCVLYRPYRTRTIALAIALGLLSLTSIYGLIMSIFLLGFFVLDQVRISFARTGARPAELSLSTSPRTLATLVIASALIVFCILTIDPPDPNPFSPSFNFSALKLAAYPDMLYRISAGFLPWRKLSMNEYWNSCGTFWASKSVWTSCVGGGLLLLAMLALYPSWRFMLIYVAAVASMLAFQQVRNEGSTRHWGHFFMLFFAGCWLLRTQFPRRSHWLSTCLLVGLLEIQVSAFLNGVVVETREVFSGGRDTADFIRRQRLQDLPLVAGPDYAVVTVAGYLRRPFIAVETAENNQTVVFHSRRRREFSTQDLVNRAVAVSRERKSPVIIVCNQELPEPPIGTTQRLLFTSRPGMVGNEIFSVYRLQAN
jgi:hypothetical protein